MFNWFKKDEDDEYTKRDFTISALVVIALLALFGFGSFLFDKANCAYTGYTYEKETKRPIFSECLIQVNDGSYVPLERYINRVLTFNDLQNGD